jgi:crotonobetainyl-CoA:carnitine CoA-transferase CaiB-like acyl-CoA transferase
MLADMGAEVIRVEGPQGEEDRTLGPFSPEGRKMWFSCTGHHKKGITLDTRKPEGRELADRLIEKADVVVHNFAPGSRPSEFLAYDRLRLIKTDIIVAAVTAYGQTGPWARYTGFDGLLQALSGMMSITGFPGSPPVRSGVTVVDISAGYNTALGIMFALYHRQLTGQGQNVDVGLLDCSIFPIAAQGMVSEYKLNGVARGPIGNQSWYTMVNTYETRDAWVVLSPALDSQWQKLAELIGRPEMIDDPRFDTNLNRYYNREPINELLGAWMAAQTAEEALGKLRAARIPAEKVHNIGEMTQNTQVAAREMLVDLGRPGEEAHTVPGFPIKMSLTPATVEGPAPLIGEHNDEVYEELLDLTPSQIAAYREQGVI